MESKLSSTIIRGRLATIWDSIWSGPRLHHQANWAWKLGVCALILYAFTAMPFEYFGERMKILLILFGSIGLIFYGTLYWRSPLMWLLGACIALQVITWLLIWLSHPEFAESSPKPSRLARWFIFLPVAWLIGGSLRNVLVLWAVAACGLAVSPWLTDVGIADLQRALAGQRVDFGIFNAQHGALLFGTCVLGFFAFSRKIVFRNTIVWWRALLWMIAIIYFGWLVFATQSRGVILGLGLGLASLLVLLILTFIWNRNRKAFKGGLLVAIVGFVFVAGAAVLTVGEITISRDEIQELDEGAIYDRWELSSNRSIDIRLNSWREAWHWIKERPLFGWGGEGRSLVIDRSSTLSDAVKNRMRHLHSSYVDMSVNFGISSLLLYFTLITYLVWNSIRLWRIKELETDLLFFFMAFLVFWLTVNLFESFLFYTSGQYVFALIIGGIVSQIWRAEVEAP